VIDNKISKLREQISAKKQAIADLDDAGLPPADALRLLDVNLAEARSAYTKAVSRLAASTLVARSDTDIHLNAATGALFGKSDEFVVGAIFTLLGDRIAEDVQAEISRMTADFPSGISDQKRAVDRKRLVREMLALERAEEAEIEAELLRGNQIERRADADPRAVLGIHDDALAAAGLL